MPIFEKDGRRIYFAHIPKSGGVSVYSAFVGAGWTIKNVSLSHSAHAAFPLLRERFGVQTIAQEGRMFKYPHPRQHAPHLIWRTWGKFDTSFSITREPLSRLLSALRYLHRNRGGDQTFEDFAKKMHDTATTSPWSHLLAAHGHLIPQHRFVAPETEIFRFEDNWVEAIAERFDVAVPGRDNSSPGSCDALSPEWVRTATRIYAKDFKKFNYPSPAD